MWKNINKILHDKNDYHLDSNLKRDVEISDELLQATIKYQKNLIPRKIRYFFENDKLNCVLVDYNNVFDVEQIELHDLRRKKLNRTKEEINEQFFVERVRNASQIRQNFVADKNTDRF